LSRRTERVGEQLRGEIARVLREDVGDPRLEMVTLTGVRLSPDLAQATVFWSTVDLPGGREAAAVDEAIASAARFVRRRLAERLRGLRRIPELHFRHDPSLELGDRTLAALRELREEREARERAAEAAEGDRSPERDGET